MNYMLIFANTPDQPEMALESERERVMAEIGAWWGTHTAAGRILDGRQLQSPTTATTVRFNANQVMVSDGPFTEAKEFIGGFALIDVADLDEALSMAKTWPAKGAVEIRPLVEAGQEG